MEVFFQSATPVWVEDRLIRVNAEQALVYIRRPWRFSGNPEDVYRLVHDERRFGRLVVGELIATEYPDGN